MSTASQNVLWVLAIVLGASGCAGNKSVQTASRLDPTLLTGSTPAEREWLNSLNTAEASGAMTTEDLLLGPTYYAASGRVCRPIVPEDRRQLLACKDQDQWFLVPSVFPTGLDEGSQ